MQYTDKVLEHLMNPRNTGEIPEADGVGTILAASALHKAIMDYVFRSAR